MSVLFGDLVIFVARQIVLKLHFLVFHSIRIEEVRFRRRTSELRHVEHQSQVGLVKHKFDHIVIKVKVLTIKILTFEVFVVKWKALDEEACVCHHAVWGAVWPSDTDDIVLLWSDETLGWINFDWNSARSSFNTES